MVKVLIPSGALGISILPEVLERGLAMGPDIIAIDGGSTDSGPYYLGTGTCKYSRASLSRNLRHDSRLQRKADLLSLMRGSAVPHWLWNRMIRSGSISSLVTMKTIHRNKFQMPFDLGDRSARPAPRCRLVLEVLAEALVLGPRGSCHWPRQPMGDLLAQDDVGRQTDGVKEPGYLQPLMGRRDRLLPIFGPPRFN